MPKDFSLEYTWIEGSMPPPHHYEYTIAIDSAGHGTVTYHPDYPEHRKPPWVEKFDVSRERLETLYPRIRELVLDRKWKEQSDPPVGGSYSWLRATGGGRSASTPTHPIDGEALPKLYDEIRGLVPKAVWDDLSARREKFVREYREK